MEITISKISELLQLNISTFQLGLIFTILLVKEDDPKMTLAKFKTKVNMKESKKDLISLHEKNIINWSGYKTAIKSLDKKENNPHVVEIIDFMNKLYNRGFSPTTYMCLISNRLSKYSVDDIKKVISNRYLVWKDDKVMSQHLNPTTIFRAKNFEKYYDEAKDSRIGESIMSVSRISLEDGQTILWRHVVTFNDISIYNIKSYKLNQQGARIGSGINMSIKGLSLKRAIKKEENKEKRDGYRELEYVYVSQ